MSISEEEPLQLGLILAHAQNESVTQCYTSKLSLNEYKDVIFANKK